MSDTRRHCDPWWHPGDPAFDRWCELRGKPIFTRKHQEKDHGSYSHRRHRFRKGVRNILPNLRRKTDDLRLKEAMSG